MGREVQGRKVGFKNWMRVYGKPNETFSIPISDYTLIIWFTSLDPNDGVWKCRIIRHDFYFILPDCNTNRDNIFLAQIHALREANKCIELWNGKKTKQGIIQDIQ
jgi:hypothetical protein